MSQRFVLDVWALLALLQREEPAASRVKQLLDQAQTARSEIFISVINLGEVYYNVGRSRGPREAEQTLADMQRLALTVVPASEERVFAAARLKMRHRISYADAFAGAAADELGAVLVIGDAELAQLHREIRIEKLLRAKK